jgi:methyl-accepting chemotaxis protein
MDLIASGAQEASAASEESLTSLKAVIDQISVAKENADNSFNKAESLQALMTSVSSDVDDTVTTVTVAAQRQADESPSPQRRHRGRSRGKAWEGFRGRRG